MKISIVTVCYNEEKNIGRTIESVLKQTSLDYEYVICDGVSKDRTLEIAESYRQVFEEKGIHYTISSKKDGGLYYGMNNGIDMAEGEYVYFLNAGDWFYADDVVEKVVAFAKENDSPDVIYGNLAHVQRNIVNIFKGADSNSLQNMHVFHQAMFTSSELMKQYKFDTKYRISADYDVLLKLKMAGKSFGYIDCVIAYFSAGGVSTVKPFACLKEHFVVCESKGIKISKMSLSVQKIRSATNYYLKEMMPLKLWYWWSINVKKRTMLPDEMKLDKLDS